MKKTLGKAFQSEASLKESDSSKDILNQRNTNALYLANKIAVSAQETPKNSGINRLKIPKFSNKELKIYDDKPSIANSSQPQFEIQPKHSKNRDTFLSLNTNCKRGETQATSNYDRITNREDIVVHSKTVNNTNNKTSNSKRSKWDKFHSLFTCVKKISTINVKRIKTMKDLASHIKDWESSVYSKHISRIINTDRRKSESNFMESKTKEQFDKSHIIKKAINIVEL